MAQWFGEFLIRPWNCTWKNTYLVKSWAPAEQLCIRTPLIKLCNTDDGFTHLDNDQDKLVSGSINGEVVAWDFNTGKPLCTLNAQHRVVCLKVKWPFVVTCATNLYKSVFKTVTKESAKGVKLFNMLDQTLIRHSLIRGILIQSCSAGAKIFTNYVFCHPQFSDVIQNIENYCAILTLIVYANYY